jgi:hypothetical protein
VKRAESFVVERLATVDPRVSRPMFPGETIAPLGDDLQAFLGPQPADQHGGGDIDWRVTKFSIQCTP